MPTLTKIIARGLVHIVADPRKFYYQKVAELAKDVNDKRILELGSGPKVNGKYYYSARHLFSDSNDFIQSDIAKGFGHPVIDVTKMKFSNAFDVILCMNVLEHVYDYPAAIANLKKALKKGGTLVVAVPFAYPLHDEPSDFWRFTEHALRKLLSGFKEVQLHYRGKREFPFGYYLTARK